MRVDNNHARGTSSCIVHGSTDQLQPERHHTTTIEPAGVMELTGPFFFVLPLGGGRGPSQFSVSYHLSLCSPAVLRNLLAIWRGGGGLGHDGTTEGGYSISGRRAGWWKLSGKCMFDGTPYSR